MCLLFFERISSFLPVPSGESSSTTNTSCPGKWSKIPFNRNSILSNSLYVAKKTNIFLTGLRVIIIIFSTKELSLTENLTSENLAFKAVFLPKSNYAYSFTH